ncbi:Zn(2)-C6 fungal-type domain-containing protein [Fusarium falciforme]|uniref:Zn(2)-C6 fungal-type domain-containing protein n=1 Tax=Fusarium falciforme TaxID=195108 RepID=UPI0023002586|nr:Zn(2)-C6 fungal-type domain-containing protein [Fusarium falciforme]WAO97007.1 Zn(2)-C6 fungal-type domain-containing protein [Fusarium falciforme]
MQPSGSLPMSTGGQASPRQTTIEKKRRRPALACEQCRTRKVRCDRNHPCTTCKLSKNQLCTYAPQPERKRASKLSSSSPSTSSISQVPPTSGPLSRVERHLVPLCLESEETGRLTGPGPPPLPAGQSWQSNCVSGTVQWTSSSLPGDLALTPESLPESTSSTTIVSLMERVKQLEHQLADTRQQRSNDAECAALCRDEPRDATHLERGTVSKTRYFGQSHWVNIAHLTPGLLDFFKKIEKEKTSTVYQHLEKCKSLARKIKARRVPAFTTISLSKRMLSRELADQLIEAYLRTFETVYRIVHVPTFRAEYERYWENPKVVSDSFIVLMQLCMAIGAAFQDNVFSHRVSASHWVFEAQFWLLSCEKSKITIIGLQILCLLHHAKNITNIGSDLTWIGAGGLLRTAMYMGLHKDPKSLSKMTIYRSEIRRRLWATVLEIVLQTSIDSGGPPLISPQDYDTEPPANIDDCQLVDDAKTSFPVAKDAGVCTQMTVPLALLKTWPARLTVAKMVNGIRSNASFNEVLAANAELTTSLHAMMRQLGKFHEAGEITSFQLRYAEFTTYRFFIALHYPILPRTLRNPVYYFSRKICTDTSVRLAATAYLLPASRQLLASPETVLSDWDFQQLFVCGTGTYRSTMTQVSLTLGLELSRILEEEPRPHYGPVSSGIAELRAILESWQELCLQRIRAGETNVKGFLGITCLLAQIDSLEANCDYVAKEKRLHDEAEAGAKKCLEVLQGMVGHEGASEEGSSENATPQTLHLDDLEGFGLLGDWAWDDAALTQGVNLTSNFNEILFY